MVPPLDQDRSTGRFASRHMCVAQTMKMKGLDSFGARDTLLYPFGQSLVEANNEY